ncbi:MAG: phage holin family protein [Acidimicrobiales bacterium]
MGDRTRTAGQDVLSLVVEYAKQETLEPLKGLGRFVVFGVAGSVLGAVGLVVCAVGLLRLLQGETGGTFAGNWSWAPYLLCAVVVLVATGAAIAAVGRGTSRRSGGGHGNKEER